MHLLSDYWFCTNAISPFGQYRLFITDSSLLELLMERFKAYNSSPVSIEH